MRESKIEHRLKTEIENIRGKAWKFTSPGAAGVPDRIILLPGGHIWFVELKAPGKKLRPLQLKRKQQLEKLGFQVRVIDSVTKVKAFMEEIQRGI